MSIATKIASITASRNTIRTKTVELGLTDNVAKLDAIATAIATITDRGTVNGNVKEGESVTLQPGYYHGGSINGIAGGGSYTLQAKEVTPNATEQTISSDEGYYGLSSVKVKAIPSNFKDVSSVTASAADVLTGKVFVAADGTNTAGTMVNKGSVVATIDGLTVTSYTIPAGYHDGTGTVSLTDDIETALAAI